MAEYYQEILIVKGDYKDKEVPYSLQVIEYSIQKKNVSKSVSLVENLAISRENDIRFCIQYEICRISLVATSIHSHLRFLLVPWIVCYRLLVN